VHFVAFLYIHHGVQDMEGMYYLIQKKKADVKTVADSAKSRASTHKKADDYTKKMQAVVEKYRLVLATGKAKRSFSLTAEMVLSRADGLFPWSSLRAEAGVALGSGGISPCSFVLSLVTVR
jgi:hypothetical protein